MVKTLNTMNNAVMVRPATIPGDHLVFLSGDSPAAKDATRTLLRAFGWRDEQMLDLGGIDTAAATETMMSIWMAVTIARGPDAPRFNWALLEASPGLRSTTRDRGRFEVRARQVVQSSTAASTCRSLRAVAQLGSALDWGSRGRRFKSCQPDRQNPGERPFQDFPDGLSCV